MTHRALAAYFLFAVAVAFPIQAADSVLLRVYFDPASVELNEVAIEKLTQSVPILQQSFQWQRIEIGGHTDTTGDEITNRKLSRDRAQAVYDFLAGQGLKMDMMTVRGYGESKPRVPETDDYSKSRNRRVELLQLDTPEPGNLDFPPE